MTSTRRLLERRARVLAEPLLETAAPKAELLSLRTGGALYAVDVTRTAEVFPLDALTPVPGAPPALLGVVTHRGRIVSVVHPGALYDGVPADPPTDGLVVALSVPGSSLGLYAEELADGEGVSRAMAAVLDADALAGDPRVVVDHEQEQGSPA